MIRPITISKISKTTQNIHINKNNTPKQETQKSENTAEYFTGCYPSFTGIFNRKEAARRDKLKEIKFNMTTSAEELIQDCEECAKKFKSPEITEYHVVYESLKKINKYIDDLNSGKIRYNQESTFYLPEVFGEMLTYDIFKREDLRNKLKPVIENEIANLETTLQEQSISKKTTRVTPEFNNNLLNSIYASYINTKADSENDDEVNPGFLDEYVLMGALYPDNDTFRHEVSIPLRNKLKEAIMLDDTPKSEKTYIDLFNQKAENVWKNLSIGTNMFVLHDPDVEAKYILNSIDKIFDESENGFGQIKKENTKIVKFNKYVSQDYITEKIRQAEKNKDKKYVFLFDLDRAKNNATLDCSGYGVLGSEFEEYLKNPPENVRYIITSEKDTYYSRYSPNDTTNPFLNYGEITVPIMNAEQTKKVLKKDTPLLKDVKKPFTSAAIDFCTDATVQLPGNFPEKTVRIMEKIASCYIDKKEITLNDVKEYIKDAPMFKSTENDSAINMVFNTGIKLKDMVGSNGTKKEAESIVRMIKDKSIGTKGYIIYAQDASQGAGRKYTAQAIAGEAKIPYVEINALDFGTEKIDLFGALFGGGGNNMTPEASMKKLFELVKSQAETNPSKSAILFIENFEYFSVGEQVSEYHQKAMSQLLREMDNAKKQGMNIVVMGSMNDPQYIGASTLKSGKFIDEIAVESPSRNTEARYDILKYYTKDKKYKIEGKTSEEKNQVLKKAAEISEGFPYVYVLAYLDKANNIAKERGKKSIGNAEFTEAMLQLECGRPNTIQDSKERKELVTSHECGHAMTLQFMYDLTKEHGNIRYLPDKVSFITIDPRGCYGGAMYPGKSENEEWSFGKIFSDLVCDFGGHSCEKLLYGIDGSWGISGDMKNATESAQLAIQYMGLGPNVGKIHIDNTITNSLDLSPRMRDKYDQDLELFLKNANLASDMIVEVYEPFIRDFTEKYKHLVGTGECIISSAQFKEELDNWVKNQPQEKLDEIEQLKSDIWSLMGDTQRGRLY